MTAVPARGVSAAPSLGALVLPPTLSVPSIPRCPAPFGSAVTPMAPRAWAPPPAAPALRRPGGRWAPCLLGLSVLLGTSAAAQPLSSPPAPAASVPPAAAVASSPAATPAANPPPRGDRLRAQLQPRFAAADRDGDGLLSRDEARRGMPRVHEAFDAIDAERSGRVSLEQILAFVARQRPGR